MSELTLKMMEEDEDCLKALSQAAADVTATRK